MHTSTTLHKELLPFSLHKHDTAWYCGLVRPEWPKALLLAVKVAHERAWQAAFDAEPNAAQAEGKARAAANAIVREAAEAISEIQGAELIGATDHDVAQAAEEAAENLRVIRYAYGSTEQFLETRKFPLPVGQTQAAVEKRLLDPAWHRRRLRAQCDQATELAHLHLRLVGGKSGAKYASGYTTTRREQQMLKNAKWLASKKIKNLSTGAVITLAEATQGPEQRIAELLTAVRGLEDLAKEKGMKWIFITATAPAHMHPNPKFGENSWDGTSPAEASRWLQAQWARVRAMVKKSDIPWHGVWTKEPHADGCPHLHAVIFCHEADFEQIYRILRFHFAHSAAALKIEIGDDSRARATTYALKYILKAVGAENFSGEGGSEASIENAEAINAAAGTWRWRRYGFWGVRRALGLWRECRRIGVAAAGEALGEAVAAALAGKFANFLKALPESITLLKEETLNRYEELSSKVIGMIDGETGEAWITHGNWIAFEDEVTVILNYPRKPKKTAPDEDGGPRPQAGAFPPPAVIAENISKMEIPNWMKEAIKASNERGYSPKGPSCLIAAKESWLEENARKQRAGSRS